MIKIKYDGVISNSITYWKERRQYTISNGKRSITYHPANSDIPFARPSLRNCILRTLRTNAYDGILA